MEEKRSLGQKTLRSVVVFALLLTVAVSAAVSLSLSTLSREHYYEDTEDYAGIISHVVDGDRIAGYLETGQKDEYYNNTEVFLTSFLDEMDMTDISIVVPDGDEMIYVWDTDGADADLGDRTAIFSGYKSYLEYRTRDTEGKPFFFRTHKDGDVFISAFAPLYDTQEKLVAYTCVTRPEINLWGIIPQFILSIFVASALASVIMMHFIYTLMNKRFIEPITRLTESAEEMVDNIERDKPVEIDVHTGDELETLAEAFTKMDADLRDYIDELSAVTAERERISGELDAAAKIQRGILPKLGLQYDILPEFDLAASMTPAREVGGDFYDIFMADDRHLALIIADVSGKGVPASLFMVATKILMKYGIKQGMSPAEVFESTNEKLIESNDMELFVTAWLALIDLDTGECTVVNAGHEHPACRKKGSIYELLRYRHSPALATLEGFTFSERSFRLEPGDSLFVYTDGVTEATNRDRKLFGEDRLIMALNKNKDAAPEELLSSVKGAIKEFVDGAPQFDDLTMLAFRFNGK